MQKVAKFLKHPTSIHLIINTLGTYLNILFSLVFLLILIHILPLRQYGVMNVLLSVSYVFANILDFGTTATIYSSLPRLYQSKSIHLYRFIKSTFFFQTVFSAIIVCILALVFPILDFYFFKTGASRWDMTVTAVSILFFVWQNTVQNMLYAAKKFANVNIFLNIANVVKLAVILVLTYLKLITTGSVIFTFGIIGPLIFFLLIIWEKKHILVLLRKASINRKELQFKYTFTYFIAGQFYNVGTRMDLFLLAFFKLYDGVGVYSLAQKIILTVVSTVISITQVLSPGFSGIQSKKDSYYRFKTAFLYLMVPVGVYLVALFLPNQIYLLIFKYSLVAHVTKSLIPAFILSTLASIPSLFILYTVKKPSYILISNIVFFCIVSLGCYILIPIKGVYGPPISLTIAFAFALMFQSTVAFFEYKKLQ